MVLSTTAEVRINYKHIEYYKEKGYEIPMCLRTEKNRKKFPNDIWKPDISKSITVRIEDLPPKSSARVLVKCDVCGNERLLRYADYTASMECCGYYACRNCKPKKQVEVCMKKYGVPNAAMLETVKEKARQTSYERYGAESILSIPEFRERIKETCQEKYGGNSPANHPEVIKKMKDTFRERHGADCSAHSPEIRAKIADTMFRHNNAPTSTQQRYLNQLYGGVLNYPVAWFLLDIYLPEDRMVIEYDGGGHELSVKHGTMTAEQFHQRQITKNRYVKEGGYKRVNIVSHKDKLPTDSVLLDMINYARTFFSENPDRSWIAFDIDQGVVCHALNKTGISFDYGELRRVTIDKPETALAA